MTINIFEQVPKLRLKLNKEVGLKRQRTERKFEPVPPPECPDLKFQVIPQIETHGRQIAFRQRYRFAGIKGPLPGVL